MKPEINPLELQMHLKQLEQKTPNVYYDHSGAQLTGWKAERHFCMMKQQALNETNYGSTKPMEKKVIFPTTGWAVRFAGVFRANLLAKW